VRIRTRLSRRTPPAGPGTARWTPRRTRPTRPSSTRRRRGRSTRTRRRTWPWRRSRCSSFDGVGEGEGEGRSDGSWKYSARIDRSVDGRERVSPSPRATRGRGRAARASATRASIGAIARRRARRASNPARSAAIVARRRSRAEARRSGATRARCRVLRSRVKSAVAESRAEIKSIAGERTGTRGGRRRA